MHSEQRLYNLLAPVPAMQTNRFKRWMISTRAARFASRLCERLGIWSVQFVMLSLHGWEYDN
jgi:hypothetical protein